MNEQNVANEVGDIETVVKRTLVGWLHIYHYLTSNSTSWLIFAHFEIVAHRTSLVDFSVD